MASEITGEPTVILQTKLTAPQPADPSELMVRERLTSDAGTARPRVWVVCAPAGFGKTTLVSQSLANHAPDERVAWLSVDSRDNDPARFVAYLARALASPNSPITGNLISPDTSPSATIEHTLNDVARSGQLTTLVIDDLDRVDDTSVYSLLAYLIEFMPPAMRLIVTSRTETPLPLSRLRAYGGLHEVRAPDLAFTPDETAAYFAAGATTAFDSATIAAIHQRTGGWAFALHTLKALLVGQPQHRVDEILAGFLGSHQSVADFLISEVLERRTPDQRAFLLRTALLSRLTGRLCDAMTGRTDGHLMLQQLKRDGVPLFALDDQRRWYRYHHLLAELLTAQLELESPAGEIERLHATACAFFLGEGLLEDAIEHALAARDWDLVVDMLQRIGYDPVGQRRVATFRRWLEGLPTERLRAEPMLSYWYGRSLYTLSQPKAARAHLERAEEYWTEAGMLEWVGDVRESRAWCAILDGRHEDALTLAREAVALKQDLSTDTGKGSRYTLAVALSRAGRSNEALDTIRVIADDDPLSSLISIERGQMLIQTGRFDEARATLLRGLQADNPAKLLLRARIWAATIELAWNDLDRAREHLDRAVDVAVSLEALPSFPSLEATWARWYWLNRQPDLALRELEDGIARARAAGFGPAVDVCEATRAGLWIDLGMVDEARAWLDERGLSSQAPAIEELLVIARLNGVAEESVTATVDGFIATAESDGRVVDAGRALIRRACMERARDRAEEDALLLRALDLLEPAGYLRAFLDDGASDALEGLERIATTGKHLEFIGRILAEAREAASTVSITGSGTAQLSPRELEVLRLVAIGLSNQDIADRLYISVPTVKRHLSTVFDKLSVTNRTQAVARARADGML